MFNVGEYRRQATTRYKNHDFFRPDNEEAMAIRIKCALDALEDVRQWLDQGGMVGVSTPPGRSHCMPWRTSGSGSTREAWWA